MAIGGHSFGKHSTAFGLKMYLQPTKLTSLDFLQGCTHGNAPALIMISCLLQVIVAMWYEKERTFVQHQPLSLSPAHLVTLGVLRLARCGAILC